MIDLNFIENDNSDYNPNSIIESYEEMISIFDKKILEEKDLIRKKVFEKQRSRLFDLKNKYENLIKNGVTKEAQYKLNILNRELFDKVSQEALLGKDINKGFRIYADELESRKDNLIDRSTRDFIEKHIRFSSDKFIKLKESLFETAFYERFTINYLDYFFENGDSTDKQNIFDNKGLIINEKTLEDILIKTIFDLIKKGLMLEKDFSIKINLSSGKELEFNINDILKDKITKIDTLYMQKLTKKSENFGKEFDIDFAEEILKDLDRIQKIRDFFSLNYKEYYTVFDYKSLQILKLKIKLNLNNQIKLKLNEIKENIKKINDLNEQKTDINNLRNKTQEIKDFIDKSAKIYGQKNLAEILGEDNLRAYKNDFDEIEKSFDLLEFNPRINEIKLLIENIGANNIKSSKNEILKKIISLNFKIQDVISKKQIDSEIGKKIIEDLNGDLYKKILEIYLKKAGIQEVTGREKIGNIQLFKVLINAKKLGEISTDEINIIFKYGYEIAFLKEFELPYVKARVETLNTKVNGKSFLESWKDIFSQEIGGIIGPYKARDMFLLAYIESIFDPEKVSSRGAVGYFQVLPGVGEDFGMERIDDLKDPIKSAKIASKYLRYLLEKNISEDIDLTINRAITEYNGWFGNRLINKSNPKETILEVGERLLDCKAIISNKKVTVKELITKIKNIHKDYYDPRSVRKGRYHFRILDDYYENPSSITKQDIENWIDSYVTDILKQQYLYPEQFEAVKRVYAKVY